MHFRFVASVVVCTLTIGFGSTSKGSEKAKQRAIAEWRQLTSNAAGASPSALTPTGRGGNDDPTGPPQVFLKDNHVRFYFPSGDKFRVFSSTWNVDRAPTDGFKLSGARLRSSGWVSHVPENDEEWRRARVIYGKEAENVGAELVRRLAPENPSHGFSYEALFADRTIYRDKDGNAKVAFQKDVGDEIVTDHHFFHGESLEILSKQLDKILGAAYPNDSLFVLMVADASHCVEPFVVDRKENQCVCLCLAALFDSGKSGEGYRVAADGLSGLVLESHCWALIKNPATSVARLADCLVQDSIRLVRIPSVSFKRPTLPVSPSGGMDLVEWEKWLDKHSGTKLEQGSMRILYDGDEFFGRFQEAVKRATNHVFANVYLFDRDDVAVEVADLLKQRSAELPVRVTYDRLCSVIGGTLPKITPMPEDFVAPPVISGYLRKGSEVQVRPLLNPWITVSHSKLFLVDGNRAWIGGMNLGREYMHEWHDVMLEIEGPVVNSLETQFEREWAHAGPWGDAAYFAAVMRKPAVSEHLEPTGRTSELRRLPTSKGLRKPFMTAVFNSLEQARSYIYIENGYLFDHGVVASLIRAQKRGVNVKVIMPRLNNFKEGIRSNLAISEKLRKHGVRVYLWPGMTHAKALLVDGWACMGSANLNQWSFRVSEEENIATSDPAFVAQLKEKVFEPDFARSYELTEPIALTFTDHLVDSVLSY